MKSPKVSKNAQRGSGEKIYFDSEAKDMLASLTVATDVPKSKLVCALIRSASGGRPRVGEEPVFALVKKAVGREAFTNFLTAASEAVGPDAVAIMETNEAGRLPEAWVISRVGVGVLAFFAPSEATLGEVFAKASRLKSNYTLSRVLVVTTNPDALHDSVRKDLAAAGIVVVSLANLKTAVTQLSAPSSSSARPHLVRGKLGHSAPKVAPQTPPASHQ